MDVDIPRPGLGTSGNDDHDQCAETVATALEMGYRHVDTAQMYDNEGAVGDGIERADVPREEVFVATKVHPDNLAYDDVHRTARESLDRLGLEYVDLLYVHWPIRAYDPEGTLEAFDELHDGGVTRHVGVSNFTPTFLEEARDTLDAPIVAHQVEMHPLLPQRELVEDAREHGHRLVAYSPLGQGTILDNPTLESVAERNDVTPAQVALAWLMDHDVVVPIPKATGVAHLEENLAARDLDLGAADVEAVDDITRTERVVDPDAAPWRD